MAIYSHQEVGLEVLIFSFTFNIYIYIYIYIYSERERERHARTHTDIKTAWPHSTSELYRPRDRCLSVKLEPTFFGQRVSLGQRIGSRGRYFRFSTPELLLFFSSSSSIVHRRLSGPHSKPTTSQKIW
jgi:hypothetical protein